MPVNAMRFRSERVFVLLVDGRPVVAFESINQMEAQELTREAWLKEDLAELYSSGRPLWTASSKASVRIATEDEIAAYRKVAASRDALPGELRLAYLVPVDAAS